MATKEPVDALRFITCKAKEKIRRSVRVSRRLKGTYLCLWGTGKDNWNFKLFVPIRLESYSAFSLTWPVFFPLQYFWTEKKAFTYQKSSTPRGFDGTTTWPPFHCFGTPIWPPRRKVIKFHREFWLPFVATYFSTFSSAYLATLCSCSALFHKL